MIVLLFVLYCFYFLFIFSIFIHCFEKRFITIYCFFHSFLDILFVPLFVFASLFFSNSESRKIFTDYMDTF